MQELLMARIDIHIRVSTPIAFIISMARIDIHISSTSPSFHPGMSPPTQRHNPALPQHGPCDNSARLGPSSTDLDRSLQAPCPACHGTRTSSLIVGQMAVSTHQPPSSSLGLRGQL